MNEHPPQPYPSDLGQGWLPKPPPPKVRDGYWTCIKGKSTKGVTKTRVNAAICQGRIARGCCKGCTAWEAKA